LLTVAMECSFRTIVDCENSWVKVVVDIPIKIKGRKLKSVF
jgi:hypothetical protein